MIYESLTTSIDGLESSIEFFMKNHARVTEQRDALVKALEKSIRNIEQLCSTANTLSNKLGLGDKVRASDFTESAHAALALAKGE